MARLILLDSGPLGMIVRAPTKPQTRKRGRRGISLAGHGNVAFIRSVPFSRLPAPFPAPRPPKPISGVFLFLRPEIDATTGELGVTQDFTSDIVVPWKRPRKSP